MTRQHLRRCSDRKFQGRSERVRKRTLRSESLERRLVLSATIGNNVSVGDQIQHFRLAIATTAEYTTLLGGQTQALAAIESLVDDVNKIFEEELSIRFDLVSGTNTIFTDSGTDGYMNGNVGQMLDENTAILNGVLGFENYDIGHVLGTAISGGQGVAGLGVATTANKGQGASISSSPMGTDWVHLVAHEFGHQFNAEHTFNGNTYGSTVGSRSADSAYEPASGSTLMSYAGIAGADNLQSDPDPYFHAASFEEIQTFIATTATPFSLTPTTNNLPSISAGSDYTIPAGTPFGLTAAGSDADSEDVLTYTWEQLDLGPAMSLPLTDNGSSPLFRSFPPSENSTRVFPQMDDLAAGVNTAAIGEALPTTDRTLNFRATVRDGKGGVDSDDTAISVVDTGTAFAVTSPNSSVNWTGGATQVISWEVGGTTANGINVSDVGIDLSLDGGLTYPFELVSSTPNDGTHSLLIPNVDASEARIRVRAIGNVFFDISDVDFAITANPSNPGLTVSESDSSTVIGEDGLVGGSTVDTYTIALNTTPSSPIDVTVFSDVQTEVSTDGISYSSSVTVTKNDTSTSTIHVRGFDDNDLEGMHVGSVWHEVTASSDPNYPTAPIGNPVTATIADDELQPVVGIDFGGSAGVSARPENWSFVPNGLGTTLTDLVREDGLTTGIGLTMPSRSSSKSSSGSANSLVPLHSPSLQTLFDGDVRTALPLEFTWTGLTPGEDYNLYVFVGENFGPTTNFAQEVSVEASVVPAVFVQDTAGIGSDPLVNATVADPTRPIESDAIVAQADASGEIKVTLTDLPGDDQNDAIISGLAIQQISGGTPGINLALTDGENVVIDSGVTDTIEVSLRSQPSGTVVIDLTSSDDGEVLVSPGSLTFDETNWNVDQTVTMTGVPDGLADGVQEVQLEVSVDAAETVDSQYDSLASRFVNVTAKDDLTIPVIGVDFDVVGGVDQSPLNWTLASSAGPLTTEFVDLIDESGQATDIDLTIAATGFSPINVGEASNVPMHPNPLERVAGIWYGTSTATLTWSDLVPGADYNLWIMGAEWFGSSSFGQIVTIDGGGADPPPFTMDFLLSGLNNLLINDQVASSASDFSDYAIQTTADENGEIELRVDPQPGRTFMGLGAVAIQEVPPQPPRLVIDIAADEIAETAGAAATTATITRFTDTTDPLVVQLTSSDSGEATVPIEVTIAAGETMATVDVDAVDDFIVDGTQTVTVTAEAVLAGSGGPVGLDSTFGVDGVAVTSLQSNYQPPETGFAVLPDGKSLGASEGPLNAGQIRLVRHNADGTPDTSFGTNGLVTVTIGTANPAPADILVLPDGKFIVGGGLIGGPVGSFVARFNPDGSLDPSFGVGGVADLSTIGAWEIQDLDLADDGKIVAAMFVGGGVHFRAMRLNAGGTLDATFGTNGLAEVFINARSDSVKALPGGAILLAGDASGDGVVGRLTSAGAIDFTFGVSGSTNLGLSASFIQFNSLQLDSQGRIVVGGFADQGAGTDADFVAARLSADGTLDSTFDSDGVAVIEVTAAEDDAVSSIQVRDDDKLLLVGHTWPDSGSNETAIVQLNEDGSVDTTFDSDGILLYSSSAYAAQRSQGSDLRNGQLFVLSGWGDDYRIGRIDIGYDRVVGSDSVDVTDNDVPSSYDYGDAPSAGQSGFASSYPVTDAENGARHLATSPGPTLGSAVDTEVEGIHSADADADDLVGPSDDEDGVTFGGIVFASSAGVSSGSVTIDLQNADPSANRLDGWIDFNRDGDWDDAGEQIFANFDLGTTNGSQVLPFSIPQDIGGNIENGLTFSRFRVSSVGSLAVTGVADDGEVEDHPLTILTANPLVVDNAADESDGDYSTGDFSLREAIEIANARAGADEIQFAPTLSGATIALALDQLEVTDELSIAGPGATDLTISGDNNFRVFQTSLGVPLSLEGLTVTQGRPGASEPVARGGGIFAFGDLDLVDVVVTNNQTRTTLGEGGGLFHTGGTLTITDSVISDNTAVGDSNFGGGVYALNSTVSIVDSEISGNSTTGDSAPGAGIIVISGNLTIDQSTISGNSTTGANSVGGGVTVGGGNLTITNSTISGNSTTGSGAGIAFDGNTFVATVTNSTISGNTTPGSGGGIANFAGTLNLNHSTVTENTAAADRGSGLASFETNAVLTVVSNVFSSIIAGNTNSDVDHLFVSGPTAPTETVFSGGFNLIGTGNVPDRFTGPNDQTGVIDPRLASLADNGGPTETHALLSGSPAIDGGDVSATETTDQRGAGFPRLIGSRVDIGAFEAPAVVELSIAATDASKAEGDAGTTTFSFTVTRSGDTSGATTVDYNVGGSGVDPANADDFGGAFPSGTVNFVGGESSKPIEINVSGDVDVESDESFSVTLSNPSAPATLTIASADGVIVNDDIPPNVAPTLLMPSSPNTFVEALPAVLVDAAAVIQDPDSPDFDGGTLTLEIVDAGEADDRLTIRNQGDGAGQIGVVGNAVTFSGTTIGTFTGGVGLTPLEVTFGSASSAAAAQALLRNIQFSSVSSTPSTTSRVISAVVTDGDGGESVGSEVQVVFDYALAYGGSADDRALSVVSDANGNVFVGGWFNDTIDADPGAGTLNFTEVGSGIGDAILSSYDSTGNLRWAKQIGGDNFEYVLSVAIDASGDVYFAGGFEGTVDFDPGPGVFELTAPDNENFILKLDGDGNFINAIRLDVDTEQIAISPGGDLFVTGNYVFSPDVDPGAGTTNLPDTGLQNAAFLLKYDSDLNYQWSSTTSGNRAEIGNGIAFDSTGAIYVGGEFSGTADFDPGAGVSESSTGSDNNIDAFIWKLDSSGNLVWTQVWGGPGDIGIGDDKVFDVAVDDTGNVYAVGKFGSNDTGNPGLTVDFDPGPGEFNLTSAGHDDIFVTKLDSDGNFLWAARAGDDSFDRGFAVELDSKGNLHIAAQFLGTADFDPSAGVQNVTSNGSSDVGLWGLNPDGEFLYAHAVGGASFDLVADLFVTQQDELLVTGVFANTVDFDPGPGTFNLAGQGGFDGFTLKLDAQGLPETQLVHVVDVLPDLAIVATDANKAEGDSGTTPFTFTVTRSGDTSGTTTVDYAVTGSGAVPADVDDFGGSFPSGTVTFVDGEASRPITIDVSGDSEIESDEGFTVTLSNPSSPAGISKATAVGVIVNDDVPPNTAPELLLPSPPITFNEGDAPVLVDPLATITDSDSVDFDGGVLTIAFIGGSTLNDKLAVRNEGVVAGQIGVSAGDVTFGGVVIGALSGGENGAPLMINFNGSSSPAIAQAVLRNVTFENVSTNPVPDPRVVYAVVSDGDGGVSEASQSALYLDHFVAFGGSMTDAGHAVAVDAAGNSYVTGSFRGTMDVDPGPGVLELTSAGSADNFVASYDTFGNLRWAHRFGNSRSQNSFAIEVDSVGQIQVGGAYSGTVDFDPGPGVTSLTSVTNESNGFLLELDSGGNFISVVDVGGVPLDIAVDSAGNRYLTGQLSSLRDFDPGAGVVNLDPGAKVKGFVTKIDLGGNLLWARQIGDTSGVSDSTGFALSVDSLGNVYTAGSFKGTVDFDPGAGDASLSTTTSESIDSDAFVQKLDSNGDFVWAKRWGAAGSDSARDIEVDSLGNVYTTGVFDETVDFDPGAGTYDLVGQGSRDVFVSKVDTDGDFVWAHSAGDSEYQYAEAITLDSEERPIVALQFRGTVDFDPSATMETRTAAGVGEIAIWKLDASGNFVSVDSFGGDQTISASDVVVDSLGDILTIGGFYGRPDLDPSDAIARPEQAQFQDVYLQKLYSAALETQTIDVVPSIDLSIAATDANKNEGDGPASTPFTFTVSRGGGDSGSVSVDYSVAGSGANPATETDFGGAFPSGTVQFAEGEVSKLVTIDVSGDTDSESDQGFTVTLSNPSAPAVIATGSADGTIVNDDLSVVSIVALSDAIEDSAAELTYQIQGSNRTAESATLMVQFTLGGTAEAGTDYPGETPTSIEIPAGQSSVVLSINPIADSVVEGNEAVVVTLVDAAEYDVDGGQAVASADILDDDSATLSIQDVSAVEGQGLLFSVSLDQAVQDGFTVDASFVDATATGGSDFDNTQIALTFAGNANEIQTFTVTTTDDDVVEGAQTFSVALDASNALVDDSDQASGTIEDNDEASLTIDDVTGTEGAGLLFTVTLDNPVEDPFSVEVTFTDGTAVGGSDYDDTPVTLDFNGAAGEMQQFTVAATDDTIMEEDEAFTVHLNANTSSGGAPAGEVDLGFGTGGQTITPFYSNVLSNDQASAVALSDTGKVFVVGNTNEILAYDSDGTIDTTFGLNGKAPLPIVATDLLVSGDQKLIVVGFKTLVGNGADFAVARFDLDGRLDTSFGEQGVATADLGSTADFGRAVTLDQDGKIVVAGDSGLSSSTNRIDFGVARFSADGVLDTGFGTGGTQRTDFQMTVDRVVGVAVDAQNRIVVVGENGSEFQLARYSTDGTLDVSFGTSGLVVSALGGISDRARDVAIDSADRIVVAGRSFAVGLRGEFSVARYNTDGSFDATFGTGGFSIISGSTGTGEDSAFGVAIDSNDRIMLVGNSVGATNVDITLMRLDTVGVLDATFGVGGIVRTPVGTEDDFARDIALDSAGRAHVVGYTEGASNDYAVLRYATDGSLDLAFSGDGIATTNVGASSDRGYGSAIQSDGKVLLVGISSTGTNSGQDYAIARYNADGTPDASFGDAGTVTLDVLTGNNEAYDVAVQSDGKIVVVGNSEVGSRRDFAAIRLNSDGTIDQSFGSSGYVTTDVGASVSVARAVEIQADGKIVLAGYRAGPYDAVVVRYNADGSLDAGFGTGGIVITDLGGDELMSAMAIGVDGKITVGGYTVPSLTASDFDFAIIRYNTDGTLDTSFDQDGIVTTDFGGNVRDTAFAIALQSDGKTVAAGLTDVNSGADYAVARYNVDGSLDAGFGTGGLVSFDFESSNDGANALAIQDDGKIVVSGNSYFENSNIGVARLTSSGDLDPSFSDDGKQTHSFRLRRAEVSDYGYGLELTSDGEIVVGGYLADGGEDFAIVRFTGVADSLIDDSDEATGTIIDDDEPPRVQDVVYFNEDAESERGHTPDSTGQRSIIRRIQVTFTAPVDVPIGAVSDSSFVLESTDRRTLGKRVGLTVVSSDVIDGKQVVILEFVGNSMVEPMSRRGANAAAMLSDGNYRFTIDGAPLGIDANVSQTGVTAVDEFYRLFGDTNGDRLVDGEDRDRFMEFYTEDDWNWLFDFDDRADRKTKDRSEFLKRIGTRLS